MSGVDASTIALLDHIMGNLSQALTDFTAPVDVDVRIVQVGGFGQQSFQLALTRTLLQVCCSCSDHGCCSMMGCRGRGEGFRPQEGKGEGEGGGGGGGAEEAQV